VQTAKIYFIFAICVFLVAWWRTSEVTLPFGNVISVKMMFGYWWIGSILPPVLGFD